MQREWTGKIVKFDAPKDSPLAGKQLTGIVEAQEYAGLTTRGSIPDWKLTVVGASGKRLVVSLVENYCQFES
jgi:hypothetical protein